MDWVDIADDANETWFRITLPNDTCVYVGGCGCCGSPWIQSEPPSGITEWNAVREVEAVSPASETGS